MEVDCGEEAIRLTIRRRRNFFSISRIPLRSIVVEDDDELVKKIDKAIEKKTAKYRERNREKGWMKKLAFRRRIYPRPPPFLSDDVGEVDVSEACFLFVDGLELKRIDKYQCSRTLFFCLDCHIKRHLKLFDHPGYPATVAAIVDRARNSVENREIAVVAINQYNSISKNLKLKLREIVKINVLFDGCRDTYYVTFFRQGRKDWPNWSLPSCSSRLL